MPSQYHFPFDLRSLIPARPRESTAETQPQLHLALLVCLFESRAYQMSVTLPASVAEWALWIWIVSALATCMSTSWSKLIHTMWVPGILVPPAVVVVVLGPLNPSKPTHSMRVPGRRSKLT